jgi:hypothetical protein
MINMNKTKHIALFWVIGLMLLTVSVIAIEVSRGKVPITATPEVVEEVLKIPVKDYDQTAYDKGTQELDREVLSTYQRALDTEFRECIGSSDIIRLKACITALENVNKGYEQPKEAEEDLIEGVIQ